MEQSGVFDVERLRREFDASFALPRALESGGADADYLLIRAGGRPYALALTEVGGVLADAAVTPVPSSSPTLLGISGLRGRIVPVFDLAALLGAAAADGSKRWLVLSAGAEPLGFAFSALEGHLRKPGHERLASSEREGGFLAGAVQRDGLWPIIGLERVVAALRERFRRERPGKDT